eukprot:2242141-Pleurochrysis_carterae.AAC.2
MEVDLQSDSGRSLEVSRVKQMFEKSISHETGQFEQVCVRLDVGMLSKRECVLERIIRIVMSHNQHHDALQLL